MKRLSFRSVSSVVYPNQYALFSCYDKSGKLDQLAQHLYEKHYNILATSSTFDYLCSRMKYQRDNPCKVMGVEHLTKHPEIFNGRVKTLHPMIFGGILSQRNNSEEHIIHKIPYIDVVVCNLYPFMKEPSIENIDIGGVSLIRAAAKNYEHVTVVTDPSQYDKIINSDLNLSQREMLAGQAFKYIKKYDNAIVEWFKKEKKRKTRLNSVPKRDYSTKNQTESTPIIERRKYEHELQLKYGMNPHQKNAWVCSINDGDLPFKVLNGKPSYINILDAMNSWNLVSELSTTCSVVTPGFKNIAAASFKHTSPAGVAIDISSYNAYREARACDPLSSFGDFIAISDVVDRETAELIKTEVSDGIIAHSYTEQAMEILKQKKQGQYVILQGSHLNNFSYEYRELYGFALKQEPNVMSFERSDFTKSVSNHSPSLTEINDMMFANICLKYGQSNNVAIAFNNRLIGMSAGQQSRIHSTRLACHKAKVWLHRNSTNMMNFSKKYVTSSKQNTLIRLIEHFLGYPVCGKEVETFEQNFNIPLYSVFEKTNEILNDNLKKREYFRLSMASDAFFPFRDNIDCAAQINVKAIAHPGGSTRDNDIIDACNDYDIALISHKKRMFTH